MPSGLPLSFSVTLFSTCILHSLSLQADFLEGGYLNTHRSPVLHLVISVATKPEYFENSQGKSLLDLSLLLNYSTMARDWSQVKT